MVWLLLLSAGFLAPGGWGWGMPGPVGHMENYVISLWFVSLVLAPLLAARDPEGQAGALRLFLLAILAILVSTIRREPLKLISDAPPWIAALLSIGLMLWAQARPWPRPNPLAATCDSAAEMSPDQSVSSMPPGEADRDDLPSSLPFPSSTQGWNHRMLRRRPAQSVCGPGCRTAADASFET
jgi:hypothetical protein